MASAHASGHQFRELDQQFAEHQEREDRSAKEQRALAIREKRLPIGAELLHPPENQREEKEEESCIAGEIPIVTIALSHCIEGPPWT